MPARPEDNSIRTNYLSIRRHDGREAPGLLPPKPFSPLEICHSKCATPEAPGNAKKYKYKVVLRAVQGSVIRFEEYQFACAVRIQSPQCHGGNHGAEESSPQNLSGKMYANFLRSTD